MMKEKMKTAIADVEQSIDKLKDIITDELVGPGARVYQMETQSEMEAFTRIEDLQRTLTKLKRSFEW